MVKQIILMAWFLLLLSSESIFAQDITGRITDSQHRPIAGVDCVLLHLSDSTQVAGMTTNAEGQFSLPVKDQKEYILQLSSVGYKKICKVCKAGNIGDVVMREDATQLKEVVVKSQMLKTFGNKDQIFLSEKTKNVGNNALDAISSLPQFRQVAGGTDLVTVDNKTILVLIDGIRRSSRDLMLLKSSDVKSINYYHNPPVRYAHENIGAVIDVTTKKRKEKLYSLYLDTKNGVTTCYGTNVLSMVYADSLNTITAAWFIDYRNLNKNIMDNTYSYQGMQNDYKGISGSYRGQYHIGQVTYQRNKGKNLFDAKVEYRKSPATQKYQQTLLDDSGKDRLNNRRLKSSYSFISADLYYMHTFNSKKNLSLDILNTCYSSSSDNSLAGNVSDYSFENYIKNKSYSLIAEVLYSDKLWNGDWNTGAYYQYKNLNQKYNNTGKSTVNTQKEYFYTDYSNRTGKMSYNAGLGLENDHYKTATNETFNYLIFRPMLTLNMEYNKYTSMRYSASVNSSVPNVGDLTNSIVMVDQHFYTQGNTGLKPYYYYYMNLGLQYSSSNGRWYLSPSVTYSFFPKKNVPVISNDKGNVIQRLTGIHDASELEGSLSFSYKPVSWIAIQPFYNYQYSGFRTPNQVVRHSLNNAGISLQLLPKNWQIIWNGNLPMTTVDGDIYERYGFNVASSILYKYKSISIGMDYIHNPNPSRVYSKVKGFSYSEETKWHNFKNLLAVTFTYYFSKGKSYRHAGKRLSNADNDSGLTKYNTAK